MRHFRSHFLAEMENTMALSHFGDIKGQSLSFSRRARHGNAHITSSMELTLEHQ
jgi:hypothetical protein